MNNSKIAILVIVCITTLVSCGGGVGKQAATADGFLEIEKELKSEFGTDAYYTDLTVMYDKAIGNMISLTVTDAPESLKMGQWNFSQNTWNQASEVTLEVPEGTKASDFMFQLNDKLNLSKLGELVEKSIEQLTAEKDIENPALEMAFIKFPKNGDIAKTEYYVKLEPENGGTSFTFSYTLNGELIKMDY